MRDRPVLLLRSRELLLRAESLVALEHYKENSSSVSIQFQAPPDVRSSSGSESLRDRKATGMGGDIAKIRSRSIVTFIELRKR